jgi:hypothetical protein
VSVFAYGIVRGASHSPTFDKSFDTPQRHPGVRPGKAIAWKAFAVAMETVKAVAPRYRL